MQAQRRQRLAPSRASFAARRPTELRPPCSRSRTRWRCAVHQHPVLDSLVQSALCTAKALRPYLDAAALQVHAGDARRRLHNAEAELNTALGLEAGESLDVLQGALLTAGLAAALERRPCETELWRALHLRRAAGEPELPGSRRLQG